MFSRHCPVYILGWLAFASSTATLEVRVVDESGSALQQALVTAEQVATGARFRVSTGAEGLAKFPLLPVGEYRLMVECSGFHNGRREGLIVQTAMIAVIEIPLRVGEVKEALEVTAAAPLLQSSRGSVGFTVTRDQALALPLDGRNFVPLIALSPGVSLAPGSVFPRINGSRPRVSEYLYDGISVLQPEPGQVAYYPVIDAIEEFRVETNSYSAEYGRANGGVVLVTQKSGGNAWHGTLFEFFRNEALNARNVFATESAKPVFRRNQYGFVLGGPIRMNKTFVFGDWQGTRLGTGIIRVSTVPTLTQRGGQFAIPVFDPASTRRTETGFARDQFPGNRIPASRFDPAGARGVSRYPEPVTAGAANNFRRTGTETTAQDQFDGRVDHYFNDRHRMFGRYAYLRDDSRPITPLPDGSGSIATGVVGDTLTRADSIAAEHNWTPSPTTAAQFRFGYTQRGFDRASLRRGEPTGIANLPAASFADVLPTFDPTGYQLIGPPANGNAAFQTSVTQAVSNVTVVRQRATVKLGADVRWQALNILQPASPTGNFQFNNILTAGLTPAGAAAGGGDSIASLLLGEVQQFTIDLQPKTIRPRATIAEFYIQSDLRLSRALSMNLGARYTLNVPSTVVDNQGAVFHLHTQRLDFLGRNGFPRAARNMEWGNMAPRIGFAWTPRNGFVVRSGYGLVWIEQAGITTPFTTPLFPFVRTLQQTSLDNRTAAFRLAGGPTLRIDPIGPDSGLGQGVFGVQRDQKSGYAQQWNVSLQKTFGTTWSFEAGYLGSKLTNLGVPDVNANQLTVPQLALGAALTEQVVNPFAGQLPGPLGLPTIARQQLLRPFPRFATVALYRNNVGHSTYHSLQFRAERRFSTGLNFTLAYTFSRLVDDAGAVFDSAILAGPVAAFQAADSHNRRLEKDVSTGNIPQIVSSGFVWNLPFFRSRKLLSGWQVGGLVRVQSGSPVAVTQQPNRNAFAGFGIQRPNRLRDPNLAEGERTTDRFFDTTAFAAAPQFTIGNSSRNPVRGPGFAATDLMLGKTFSLNERLRLEFRANAFNVANSANFGNPNGAFGTPAFGTITTAFDPRVVEFALKLHF